MVQSCLPVLIAATLAATSTAIDFSGQNDITQSAGTVAPGSETQTSTSGSYDSPNQWTQTASSSNNVPTMASSAPSSVSGSQRWSQPDSPSVWSGQASGSGNQGWTQPRPTLLTPGRQRLAVVTTKAGRNLPRRMVPAPGHRRAACLAGPVTKACPLNAAARTTPRPLRRASVLNAVGRTIAPIPANDFSFECSGSSEEGGSQSSVPTSTAGSSDLTPTTTTAPTTSSGTGDQMWSQPASTASSSNTATSAASGEYEESNPITSMSSSSNTATSTASSETGGAVDQGSSQETTQASSTASSSNTAQSTASSATQEGSDATQTSTNSTSSGDHATFGTVTSKSGECVTGNPDKYVTAKDVDWIWTNRIGPSAPTRDANWNIMDNKNFIMDHIIANKGSLNYCVRWDSTEKLSKSMASKFKAMLERQYAAWNHWLIGYDCWPYTEIKVNIVGFAVKDASLLEWIDDSLGVPQCDQKCYRFYDNGLLVRH